MTSKPEVKVGSHLLPGLAALALFVVLVAVTLRASFGDPQGFASDAGITASIGYAMFNLGMGSVPSEGFLVAFEIIDVVLVAALVAAVMLARREEEGAVVALLADGGRELRDRVGGDDGDATVGADDADDGTPTTDTATDTSSGGDR